MRQVSELMLNGAVRWHRALQTDRLDTVLFQVVLSANLAHVPLGTYVLTGSPARRAISLLAIAQSMHLPYETVRRRIASLRAKGLIEVDADGARVPIRAMSTAVVSRVVAGEAAALEQALRALAADDYGPAVRALAAGAPAIEPRVQARALLDFAVRTLDGFVPLYGSLTAGVLCSAIIAANVRHLMGNPAADAARLPSDAERRPVPLRALARELALPWETVRRHAAALIAAGMVEMVEGGAIVPSRVIAGEGIQAYNRHILTQFERLLASLTRIAPGGGEG